MSGLSALFSESTLEKFQRKDKPVEFSSRQRDPTTSVEEEVAIVNSNDGKKKKRKRQPESTEDVESSAVVETISQEAELSIDTSTSNLTKDSCTLFVGNLPTDQTVKSISALFKEFGDIESVRLRSVPVAGTAVDEKGNQDRMKKICVNKKKFGDQKGSFNAYVVFKESSSVDMAISINNLVVSGRHIRCDKVPPSLFDPKRSVFIGGLPHYTDEEQLRNHFATVMPDGQENIISVRVVRDAQTLLCKGVGYMLFQSSECVLKALSLHNKEFKKRQIRVTVCGKRTKMTEARKNGIEKPAADFVGKTASTEFMQNAERRILKKRNVPKHSKLPDKPKKTKQLGGVVKRAMKMQKTA